MNIKIEFIFFKRQWFFLSLLLCVSGFAFGQRTITGKVLDDESKEALLGASVFIKGSQIGTVTDQEGNFSLSQVKSNDTIVFSHVGYFTLEVGEVDANDPLLVEMMSTSILLSSNDIIITYPAYNPKSKNYKESPALVTLPNAQLQLEERTSIAPALNRVPGVFMHTGALNTNRITVRGIGSRNLFGTAKIRAFLDDIPLTNGSGETTLEDIDLSLVDNVQIVKGPTSSAYGAGLGGVIYLNTEQNRDRNEVQLSNTIGSYNLQRNILQYRYGKDNLSLNIGLNRTHSDGYRENNEYDRLGFTLLGRYEKEDKVLSVLFNHIDLKAFIPSSLNEEDFRNEPQKAAFTWGQVMGFEDYTRSLIGLSYATNIGRNLQNTTSLFSSSFRSYESRPFNILRQNSTSMGGRSTFKVKLRDYNEIRFGTEFFHENYDWQTNVTNEGELGTLLSDNSEMRQYWNNFVQTRWYIGDFIASAGLNLNITNYDLMDRFPNDSIDISGDYSFEPVLSPFLTLHYEPNWLNTGTIFGVVSHGFAPPTLEETLTPDGMINPDIQPEQGWNFEIGARGTWDRITYNISLYSMQIEDLLVARRTAADAFIGINAGRTVHNGLELSLESEYQIASSIRLFPFLNYAYSDYRFDEFVDGEQDFSGNELTGTAPHIASAGIRFESFQKKDFYGNINYQFVDAMPLRDDNSIYSESYQLLNAKAGYIFKLNDHFSLDFFAGINNIFDTSYASMLLINAGSFGGRAPRYYYPGLPRNFYGGLHLRYAL